VILESPFGTSLISGNVAISNELHLGCGKLQHELTVRPPAQQTASLPHSTIAIQAFKLIAYHSQTVPPVSPVNI